MFYIVASHPNVQNANQNYLAYKELGRSQFTWDRTTDPKTKTKTLELSNSQL